MRLWLISLFMGFLLFPLGLGATPEKPALGLSEAYPTVGQEVEVMVSHAMHPLDQFKVKVTYRPNSTVSKDEELGMANDNGLISWTPKDAGVTVLTAIANEGTETEIKIEKKVSVRYGHFPPLGIAIFVFAGLTLFGGLILTVMKMGKSPQNA